MSDPLAEFTGAELSAERLEPLLQGDLVPLAEVVDKFLWDGRVAVRRNAAHYLRLGGKVEHDNLAWLMVAAKDSDPVVREYMVGALVKVGLPASEVVPALNRGLCDPAKPVAEASLQALTSLTLDEPEAMSDLLTGALADGGPFVVATARDLLTRIPAQSGPRLVEALRDSNPHLRGLAREVLEELGRAVVPALAQGLTDPTLREEAAALLAQINGLTDEDKRPLEVVAGGDDAIAADLATAALQTATLPPRVPTEPMRLPTPDFGETRLDGETLAALAADGIDLRLLMDGRVVVRLNALAALSTLGGGAGEDAVEAMTLRCKDSDAQVRVAACETIGGLGKAGGAAARAVVGALSDRAAEVASAARAALLALGEIAVPALAESMLVVSTAGDLAADVLAAIGGTGLSALTEAAGDERTHVAVRAVRTLGSMGPAAGAGARAAVEQAFEATLDVDLMRACARALDGIDAKPLPPAVLEAVALPVEGFDTEALEGAAIAATSKSLDAALLVKLLANDGRALVRGNAARALGALGAKALGDDAEPAATTLCHHLKDGDHEVRRAVAGALGALAIELELTVAALIEAMAGARVARLPEFERATHAAISTLGDAAIPALVDALRQRGEVGVVAGELLADAGKAGLAALLTATESDNPTVQLHAVMGLSIVGRPAGAPGRIAVQNVFGGASDASLMRACSAALDHIDGKKAPPAVLDEVALPVDGFDTEALEVAVLVKASKSLDAAGLVRLVASDGRAVVRANAARGLAALGAKGVGGEAAAAVRALCQRLKDSHADVRLAAADALGSLQLEPDTATPPLVEALAGARLAQLPDLEEAASRALDALGAAAVPGLADCLELVDPVAETAARLLAAHGDKGRDIFIAGLAVDIISVQVWSATGMGLLGPAAGSEGRAAVKAVFDRSSEVSLLRATSAALDAIDGLVDAAPVLEEKSLPLEAFEEGPIADAALAKAAPKLDVDRLSDLLFDGREHCRANAARALGHAGKGAHDHISRLALALKDGHSEVRVAAAEALGRLGQEVETVVPELAAAFLRGDEDLREAVLGAVDAYGQSGVAPMLGLLAGRPEKLALLSEVAKRTPKTYVPPLEKALKGGDTIIVQENAADALMALGAAGAAAEKTLLEVINTSDVPLKCKAIRALGRVGKPGEGLRIELARTVRDDNRESISQAVDDAMRWLRVRQK